MPPVYYHLGRFPPEDLDWDSLMPLVGQATASLARYDGISSAIPNADTFLSSLSYREAVYSTRIEGTQAEIGEVLEFEAGGRDASSERLNDMYEVVNYRLAMVKAEELLETLPISKRVLRQIHEVLLEDVRGRQKSPGEYRSVSNWIGPPGCTIEDAKFVPPSPDKMNDALDQWEKYLHEDTRDLLVQAAIMHAEFEAIHPFLDGNGRLGRIIIPIFLWKRGLIRRPMFYISAYFEAHRDEYYERLLAVSRDDDWTGWCRFFLQAVQTQAEDNFKRAKGILDLYDVMKSRVTDATRSRYSIHALDWIFRYPVFSSTDFVKDTPIPQRTARSILDKLVADEVLEILLPGRGRRASLIIFPELLGIAEGNEQF